jgi:hypothetical protein
MSRIGVAFTPGFPTVLNKWLLQSLFRGASVQSGGGDDDCKESKADHDGDARGDGKWVAAMRAESLCGKCSTEISHGDGESG